MELSDFGLDLVEEAEVVGDLDGYEGACGGGAVVRSAVMVWRDWVRVEVRTEWKGSVRRSMRMVAVVEPGWWGIVLSEWAVVVVGLDCVGCFFPCGMVSGGGIRDAYGTRCRD